MIWIIAPGSKRVRAFLVSGLRVPPFPQRLARLNNRQANDTQQSLHNRRTFERRRGRLMRRQKMPYGTARWQRRRRRQLEAEPLCWMCQAEGKTVVATVADHDPPHKGCIEIFWNGRLRSLCKRHHDSDKQRIEKGGKSKPLIGEDGWPVA